MFDTDLYDDYDLILCGNFAVDISAGEILTGFSTVARDYNLNMCAAVNPDSRSNLYNMEYFKLFNSVHPYEATKIARIKFRCPEYVIHHNNGGKSNWTLNASEKTALSELLRKPCGKYPDLSVWQTLIFDFNNETGSDCLPEDLEIPDYSLI